VDSVNHKEALRALVWDISNSCAISHVSPQLQLWYLHWLLFMQCVGSLHSEVPHVRHFMSHGDAAAIIEIFLCLDGMDHNNIVHISPCHSQLRCYSH
jgi:hypothetical protein